MRKKLKILTLPSGEYFDTHFRCVVSVDGERASDGTYDTKFVAFPDEYTGDVNSLPTIDQRHGA